MIGESSPDGDIENAYRKRATLLFIEVVAIQVVSLIVATVVLLAVGPDGLLPLALLSLGVSYLVVMRLFRHVDTLVLTRLVQVESGLLTHSPDPDSTTPAVSGGESSDE